MKGARSGPKAPKRKLTGGFHPRKSWADYDFAFLAIQPKNVQRLAALYEYARESDALISAITKRRDNNTSFPKSLLSIYPEPEIQFLSEITEFPTESFKTLFEQRLLPSRLPSANDVEVDSASEFFQRFEEWREAGFCETLDQFVQLFPDWAGGSTYVVTIPWGQLPAGQLAHRVGKLLLNKVRQESGGRIKPARTGRRGTPTTRSGMDMLHQLGVYRFQRKGGLFRIRPNALAYASRKGWNKAFRAAEKRITQLATRYPFV